MIDTTTYDGEFSYTPKRRRGKEDANSLRKRVMTLQEENQMLHCEIAKLKKELAQKKQVPVSSRTLAEINV